MRIVFLGNFGVPYSTESHHKWTWEKMGHEVTALDERTTPTDRVVEACRGAQLFQWTHTHGWSTPGPFSTEEMVARIRALGVRSFSYHLDRYFGLDAWDRRQSLVGQHASWKVDHWFSTDGGHEDFFRSRGVNHHYLPPGVVEYGCYSAGSKGPSIDVLFAGSVTYHPEYPFRRKLVDGLQSRYGAGFRSAQGYREERLNELYASAKVVVGDHAFAGEPRYWSDRAPETCGRGGFLVYPETEGLCIPTATYRPQDLQDLFEKVDHYLASPNEREKVRLASFEHVKEHDTYTKLLGDVLKVVLP